MRNYECSNRCITPQLCIPHYELLTRIVRATTRDRLYGPIPTMVIPSIMHYALRIMNLFNDNLRRLIAVSHHINPF